MMYSPKIITFCFFLILKESLSQVPVPVLIAARPPPRAVLRLPTPTAYLAPTGPRPIRIAPLREPSNLIEEETNYGPTDPYNFGYDVKDEYGNHQFRKEEADGRVVRGSYGYTDALGLYRYVDYVADHNGFKANIRSNEPGISNSPAADITLLSEDPPRAYLEAASSIVPTRNPAPARLRTSFPSLNDIKPISSNRAPVSASPPSSSSSEETASTSNFRA